MLNVYRCYVRPSPLALDSVILSRLKVSEDRSSELFRSLSRYPGPSRGERFSTVEVSPPSLVSPTYSTNPVFSSFAEALARPLNLAD